MAQYRIDTITRKAGTREFSVRSANTNDMEGAHTYARRAANRPDTTSVKVWVLLEEYNGPYPSQS